jgi:hypothetical protein
MTAGDVAAERQPLVERALGLPGGVDRKPARLASWMARPGRAFSSRMTGPRVASTTTSAPT